MCVHIHEALVRVYLCVEVPVLGHVRVALWVSIYVCPHVCVSICSCVLEWAVLPRAVRKE